MRVPPFINLAKHDPETYSMAEVIVIDGVSYPLCPVCNCVMVPASEKRNNNKWECPNKELNESKRRICDFIEGKLGRRSKGLWDCRYEAKPM